MSDYLQVMTTVESKDDAIKIARRLVEEKLAACVQVLGPIWSSYRWKGKIEVSEEWICFIKTESRLYQRVESHIKKIHPYEVPEIVGFPLVKGSSDYLTWISNKVR